MHIENEGVLIKAIYWACLCGGKTYISTRYWFEFRRGSAILAEVFVPYVLGRYTGTAAVNIV
jgi:hypothetical protein